MGQKIGFVSKKMVAKRIVDISKSVSVKPYQIGLDLGLIDYK